MNEFKKIIFAAIILAGSNMCFAQEISIRGGFNLSKIIIRSDGQVNDKNSDIKSGYHIGPIIDFKINNLLSLETGLMYTTKGVIETWEHTTSPKSVTKINIAYLDVPLTIKAAFPYRDVAFFGIAGGYIASGLNGYILSMEDKNGINGTWQKITWGKEREDIKRIDFGLNLGIGIKYKALEYRVCYEIGLSDMVAGNHPSKKTYNRSLELNISYKLWNKLK